MTGYNFDLDQVLVFFNARLFVLFLELFCYLLQHWYTKSGSAKWPNDENHGQRKR